MADHIGSWRASRTMMSENSTRMLAITVAALFNSHLARG